MTNKHTINSEKRTVFGKEMNKFRREGKIPANIYGKTIEAISLFINEKELQTLLREAGENALVEVSVGSEKSRPALMRNISKHPTNGKVVHVDFQQINLKEKITVMVVVELTGENELATKGEGLIETVLNEIEVEALPTDLPENFTIDIALLTEVGQQVKVKDLTIPKGVEILTDAEHVIVTLSGPQAIVEEEVATTEAAQVEGVENTEVAAESESTEESK